MGRDRMVSINELADMISEIAGIKIQKKHIEGPEGVRGRNSDNTLLEEVLEWSPQTPLEEGLVHTYGWIEKQVEEKFTRKDEDLEKLAHSEVIKG
jgi:nucleoside-diphosphate-sugar epimerase